MSESMVKSCVRAVRPHITCGDARTCAHGRSHLQSECHVNIGVGRPDPVLLPLRVRERREEVTGDLHPRLAEIDEDVDDDEVADHHVEDHRGAESVPRMARGRGKEEEDCGGDHSVEDLRVIPQLRSDQSQANRLQPHAAFGSSPGSRTFCSSTKAPSRQR